jgi:hypothetical protein
LRITTSRTYVFMGMAAYNSFDRIEEHDRKPPFVER